MMALFDAETSKQLQEILIQMQEPVQIILFTQEIECHYCQDAHLFLEELVALDDRLSLTVYKFDEHKEKATLYKVDKVPVILLLNKDGQDARVRFYGIPAGFEINAFLFTLLAVSGVQEEIPPEIKSRIDKLDRELILQVFVSHSCPHCPDAVIAANFLAMSNPKIRAEMIETSMFTHLAIRYEVSGVPKTVVNDQVEWVGVEPIPVILDTLEKLDA